MTTEDDKILELLSRKSKGLILANHELINKKLSVWISAQKNTKVDKFLEWFNSRKKTYLGSPGRYKILTGTDEKNYRKLIKAYDIEDFELAIKNLFKSEWAISNNMCTPSHFLRNENFNKYVSANDNDKKILNKGL